MSCRACAILVVLSSTFLVAWAADEPANSVVHPRLYFTAEELPALHAARETPGHARIWKNLQESADWCLKKTPRTEWIAPVAEDPVYENLYDRFYAMMQDMAITEHLAFAYALSGDARYGDAARDWVLAACRAWKNDADATPDGGKAYAVCRLIKGVAVGYDMVYDRLSEAERDEVRGMLAKTAANYHQHYFNTPSIHGPTFFTHHAVVEFSSFGVVGLALLGEVPEAQQWVDDATRKFTVDLLPRGLAEDGAQTEGATFWASTMHYRLFYMDALRRVTGRDLYKEFERYMNADLALATIATHHNHGWSKPHQSVVLEPPYGQLDYYAPVLAALAREYRKPIYQYLASWDQTLGGIQQTQYITPNRREQLLFALGGYAYVWYDPTVPAESGDEQLSRAFPSVGQAYLRNSWRADDLLAGVARDGSVVVHAGGEPVFVVAGATETGPVTLTEIEDDGETAWVGLNDGDDTILSVELRRPDRVVLEWKKRVAPLSFWRYTVPSQPEPNVLKDSRVEMRVVKGTVASVKPDGFFIENAVGNGKLKLHDPVAKRYPLVEIQPDAEGNITIEIISAANTEADG